MKTKDRIDMSKRMREWWTTVRYPSDGSVRTERPQGELMFERLRIEFALEPVPSTRRSP